MHRQGLRGSTWKSVVILETPKENVVAILKVMRTLGPFSKKGGLPQWTRVSGQFCDCKAGGVYTVKEWLRELYWLGILCGSMKGCIRLS